MLNAGQKWLDEHRENAQVNANFHRLIQFDEDALLPMIGGVSGFVSVIRRPDEKTPKPR